MRTTSLITSTILGIIGVVIASDPSIKFIFGVVSVGCVMLLYGIVMLKHNKRINV